MVRVLFFRFLLMVFMIVLLVVFCVFGMLVGWMYCWVLMV